MKKVVPMKFQLHPIAPMAHLYTHSVLTHAVNTKKFAS